jgi:hypothetical protein
VPSSAGDEGPHAFEAPAPELAHFKRKRKVFRASAQEVHTPPSAGTEGSHAFECWRRRLTRLRSVGAESSRTLSATPKAHTPSSTGAEGSHAFERQRRELARSERRTRSSHASKCQTPKAHTPSSAGAEAYALRAPRRKLTRFRALSAEGSHALEHWCRSSHTLSGNTKVFERRRRRPTRLQDRLAGSPQAPKRPASGSSHKLPKRLPLRGSTQASKHPFPLGGRQQPRASTSAEAHTPRSIW